jgi:CRISPR-associated protein Cmr6
MSLALPRSTVRLINAAANNQRHPGLQLDKHSVPGDQTAQKEALAKVCNSPGDSSLLKEITERRNRLLATLPGASSFRCATAGPLTLHLARASALENAGICLHPLYGFAYIPGSGLKGMARAYAETIWLPARPDQKQAWRQIEDVFGWAPNPDRRQQVNDPNHPAKVRRKDDDDPESPENKASSGNIVFHDAWPESWPKLIVDIVNNHHPNYYQHDDNDHPPGDWENPVPVYFLAVSPGVTFTFPLAKRRADVGDELLKLARQWLLGALCHLGAGAKTNAGYGAFKPAEDQPPTLPARRRAVFETTLELVTPAFLAGANQQAEDCDLRPATLRGLLRWWWRTMHAGFVDVKTLRALEAAIWGDTKAGGAVRITVTAKDAVNPVLFNRQAIVKQTALPKPPDNKTTQGLTYHSFGMDEKKSGVQVRRYFLEPGTKWTVKLTARAGQVASAGATNNVNELQADVVIAEAKAALALLCHFGGVGAKCRKGFGSFIDMPDFDLDAIKKTAAHFRTCCGLANRQFQEGDAKSPSLEQLLGPLEISTEGQNWWLALDQLAAGAQTFAKQYKRKLEKKALGLPRRVGTPAAGQFKPGNHVKDRHASPVLYHFARIDGNLVARIVAFPAAELPNLADSRKLLQGLLDHLKNDLDGRFAKFVKGTPPPAGGGGVPSPHQQTPLPSSGPSLPRPGEQVDAVLLEEKTKKGGWKAKHVATDIAGPIQNSNDVPGEKKAGDSVKLIVASANQREISFRYPTAADEQRAQKQHAKPKGGPGGQRPRGRR